MGGPGERGPRWIWLPALAAPVILGASLGGAVAADLPRHIDVENAYPNLVFGSLVPLLGALIVARLPRNPVGWLFVLTGLASAVTVAVYEYANYALIAHPGSLPLPVAAAWVSSWVWTLGFAPLVTVAVLLFPDGRLPSPRWRYAVVLDVVAVLLLAASNAFLPGPLVNHPVAGNPLGVPLPTAVFHVIGGLGFGLLLVGIALSTISTVLRWRRARGTERAQLGWFALATVLLAVSVLAPLPSSMSPLLEIVAIPLLPVAVAVAILRNRLYGIEVVFRRSLVYGGLTVVLLLGYAATVLVVGGLVGGRDSRVATLTATALVAVAFAPVRTRLQAAAGRLLYGEGRDPYRVLTGLGRRLDDRPDAGTDALAEVAATVAASLKLPFVRVEVSQTDEPALVATHGTPVPDTVEVPLTFRGDRLGRLVVGQRTPRDPFRPADLRLLEDLGRQIGVAAHSMLLSRDLQRSRESLVTMREEERRRIRRDLHDGLGPTLAGIALGLDAVPRLAAQDPGAATDLAAQLKAEVHAALADVRQLVEDLRPPALDQLGLAGALRHHAGTIGERDPGLDITVCVDGLPQLSAAVEVAAYRIATEALTNVSRHAAARECQVSVTMSGTDSLVVAVEDDGVGLAGASRHGVGMAAMRERAVELGGTCEARPAPRGGTLVEARIPVASP